MSVISTDFAFSYSIIFDSAANFEVFRFLQYGFKNVMLSENNCAKPLKLVVAKLIKISPANKKLIVFLNFIESKTNKY